MPKMYHFTIVQIECP